jgi:hypothetical protein
VLARTGCACVLTPWLPGRRRIRGFSRGLRGRLSTRCIATIPSQQPDARDLSVGILPTQGNRNPAARAGLRNTEARWAVSTSARSAPACRSRARPHRPQSPRPSRTMLPHNHRETLPAFDPFDTCSKPVPRPHPSRNQDPSEQPGVQCVRPIRNGRGTTPRARTKKVRHDHHPSPHQPRGRLPAGRPVPGQRAHRAGPTPDPPDGSGDYYTPPQQTVVTRVIHDGTSVWVFVLVAAVAVCLTIAAALAIQALRHARATSTTRIKRA